MKRWQKALSAFIVATVMSVGVGAVAGCKNNKNPNPTPEHTHNIGTEWSTNEFKHWHDADCGIEDHDQDKGDHRDEINNETKEAGEDGKCDVCGYEMSGGGEHTHNIGTEWSSNASKHWHDADCGIEEHDQDKDDHRDEINNETKEAGKDGKCDVCDYVMAEPVTVQFVTGEGASEVKSIQTFKGEKLNLPDNPKKTGFVFGGWYVDADTDNEANKFDATKPLEGNLTLHAKWNEVDQSNIFEVLSAKANNIISENFDGKTTESVGVHSGTYGNADIYVDSAGSYEVKDGKLIVGASNSSSNIAAVVDFGIVEGEVEGYFEFTMNEESSSGNFNNVNFYNQGNNVLQIMAVSGGNFTYKVNGAAVTAENNVASAKNILYKVQFKFDLESGKLTLKINDTAVFTEYEANINAVTGFNVMTSNSGKRSNTIDNIAVCGNAVSLENYANSLVAKLAGKLEAMTNETDGTHTQKAEDIEAAHDLGKAAVEAAADHVAAYKAYNDAVTAMNAFDSDAKLDALDYIEEMFAEADYTVNAQAYAAEIAKIKAEKDDAKLAIPQDEEEFSDAGETLKAVLLALGEIKNDADCFEDYSQEVSDRILETFDAEDYKINEAAYDAVFEEYAAEIGYSDFDSYEEAKAAIDKMAADITVALEAIKTDAQEIEAEIDKQLADETDGMAAYKADEIANLDDPNLVQQIAALKAGAADAVKGKIEAIMAVENFWDETAEDNIYYVDAVKAEIDKIKAEIDKKIALDDADPTAAKENAEANFAQHVADKLATITEDADFKAELENAKDAPALAWTGEEATAGDYNLGYENAVKNYNEWFEGKLDEGRYTVSVNGVAAGDEAKVNYGGKVNASLLPDPTADDNSKLLDSTDSNYYTDEECTQPFNADAPVYANVVLYRKTVEAVLIATKTNNFNYSQLTAIANDTQIEAFQGEDNAFLSLVAGGTVRYRTDAEKSSTGASVHMLQCAGDVFTVTFSGAGSLNLELRGTGSNKEAPLSLKSETGVYADLDAASVAKSGVKALDNHIYVVSSSNSNHTAVTFIIEVAGTYTLRVNNDASHDNLTVDGVAYNTTNVGMARISKIEQVINAHKEPVVKLNNVSIQHNGEAVSEEAIELAVGSTYQLDGILNPVNTNYVKSIAWSSDNEEKVSVNSKGLVTAKSVTSSPVTITFTVYDLDREEPYTATVKFTVPAVEATGIDITKDGEVVDYEAGLTIASGTLQLGYNIPDVDGKTPNNVDLTTVSWTSSDKNVVTVDKDGKVTVVGAGTATITVEVMCIDSSVLDNEIEITVPAVAATEITLDKTTLTVYVGDDFDLKATLNTVTHNGITWEVIGDDDEAIVEFLGDNLYGTGVAKGEGTVTIKVSLDGVDGDEAVATCTVNVVPAPTTVPVTRALDLDTLADKVAAGKNAEITTSKPDPVALTSFFTLTGGKISNKTTYISLADGAVLEITTNSDNAKVVMKFQSNQSDGSRNLTFTRVKESDEDVEFSVAYDYKTKEKDLEITLGKAGTYTITATGEIKFYYMNITHNEEVEATESAPAQLEAILPENKND